MIDNNARQYNDQPGLKYNVIIFYKSQQRRKEWTNKQHYTVNDNDIITLM